jgi:hypothetical protein
METDVSPGTSGWTRSARQSSSIAQFDDGIVELENYVSLTNLQGIFITKYLFTANPTPGPSRRQDAGDSGDGEGSNSRLLNLDVLSFDSNSNRYVIL